KRRHIPGAGGEFDDERIRREQFGNPAAAVESFSLENDNRKRRGVFQVGFERFTNFFAGFVAEALERFHSVEKNNLLRGKHGDGLRALQHFFPAAASGRKLRHSPVTGGFGNEFLDERLAAAVAKIRVRSQEQNRGNRLALGDGLQEIV